MCRISGIASLSTLTTCLPAVELRAELDRRLAEHRADPGSAVPWETVRARLRARR